MRKIVISDPHGRYQELVKLLELVNYNSNLDELYLLGDYVDRGIQSKETVILVLQLSKYRKVTVLGGNHDDMFINWLDGKDDPANPYTNKRNGGIQTITSFCDFYEPGINEDEAKKWIMKHYQKEIRFLRKLPHYAEDESHIYVHAGVDFTKSNWKNTSARDFKWIREAFYNSRNRITKTIVFGHTPCALLRQNDDPSIWFSEGKIGIDGGILPDEQLNALMIEKGAYSCLHIKNFSSFDASIKVTA